RRYLGALADAAREFLRRRRIIELDTLQLLPTRHEMNMRIIESGKEKSASGVDHLCVRAAPSINVAMRADGDDAVSKHRNCLRRRHGLVHGPDFRVGNDEIGSWSGLSLVPFRQHDAIDKDDEAEEAISTIHECVRTL